MKKTSIFCIGLFSLVIIGSLPLSADFLGIGKAVKKAYKSVEKGAKKAVKEVKKTAAEIGRQVEKTGGVVSSVGVKVGNTTVKGISKAGEVTIAVTKEGLSRADKLTRPVRDVVLKAGQVFVTTTGLVLFNTGGMLWALTKGDLDRFKECASAVDQGMRYGVSTVVDETLKTIGSVDHIVKITGVSIEASSAELAFQGKTPKMAISGSFWGRDFNLKDVQLDLSRPDLFVTNLLELLVKLKIG